ncbi:MAG: MBL fold metallo-hydrolase [Ruminococcaceae bacterium]|nr:MBL fold metallo-hydrolase [Oscillospiraceae bacterium]
MIKVTFLDHSGFLVELDSVTLLFDWWKGALPPLPDKPLLILVSHAHPDHFQSGIFRLDDGARPIRYLLGSDIVLSAENRRRWGVSPQTAGKVFRLGGNETMRPLPDVTVETLPSTDEGVAWLVTADGQTIFHAGDLNWWHWEGEPDPWNPDIARLFFQYTEPLRDRTIDLAMLPLDPRQREDGFRGASYLLEIADIRRWIPMHLWGDYDYMDAFLFRYPSFEANACPVRRTGEQFEF